MPGYTNVGKRKMVEYATGMVAHPTNFYIALVTSATVPSVSTTVLSQLTEIAAGNGYTANGYALTPGNTDFDSSGISGNVGYVQITNVAWTASGGSIPSSGDGARYAVFTDDSADPSVIGYWDLGSDRSVGDGNVLTLEDFQLEIRETEP